MPLPAALTGANANKHVQVWTGQIGVRGADRSSRTSPRSIAKTFTAFVEIYEQTSHDAGFHQVAKQRGIGVRRAHEGQVSPANNGADRIAYYAVHGEEAAAMVSEYITKKWNETVGTNNNVFVRQAKNTLASQKVRRANGFSYEITMWYDNSDVYLAFHCYHNDR